LKERVLQTIIRKAVHPIVEYQADTHSFGFRPQRSGLDAISIISSRLIHLGLNNSTSGALPTKVSFETFQKCGDDTLKMKTRIKMQDPTAKKRRRAYIYDY
jgi:hypothetical protein